MYWLGDAPSWDMPSLGKRIASLTQAVRKFFGEDQEPFRVFWRRAAKGYGGAGGFRSFMLEYTPGPNSTVTEELSPSALENLISHESVHGYALMSPVRQEDVWYREGAAVYYAVVAPFLAGVVDRGYLTHWLNNAAQSYYTGGTTRLDWKYVMENYWSGTQLVRTSYCRGFIYLAQVQGLVSEATNGTKGVDDLVRRLYQRYKSNYPVQSEHFIAALADYIGQTAAETSFEGMKYGKNLVIPSADSLRRFGLKMIRNDSEELELGFSEESLGRGVVSRLVPGSRAEQAGLHEGDVIVRSWGLSTAADAFENNLKVVVQRDGKQMDIVYWPRSHAKVECYQWVSIGSSE